MEKRINKKLKSLSPRLLYSHFQKLSLMIFALFISSTLAYAQVFVPATWQEDPQKYSVNPWVRDSNGDRIDDFILDPAAPATLDIIVDLNRFVPRDTLFLNYSNFTQKDDSIYVDNYISFLYVPDVKTSDVRDVIINRKEVYLIEYAGVFRGDLDISVPTMAVRPGGYSDNIHDSPVFKTPSGNLLTGDGVGIIILDAGVDDIDHQALYQPKWYWDFSGSPILNSNPLPYTQHATVMALVAFGKGDKGGNNKGVARVGNPGVNIPGVTWGDIKIFSSGLGEIPYNKFDKVVAALDEIIKINDPVRLIVNMSFSQVRDPSDDASMPPMRDDGREAFSQLVNYVVQQGIVCVTSAGNYGLKPGDLEGAITSPGAAFFSITAGPSSTEETPNRSDDEIPKFASKGPLGDRGIRGSEWKPDIAAPGSHEVSPWKGFSLPTKGGYSYTETTVY
ncbi:MAG: S8 family serine peptidase, partial [Candidatus Hodarchaeota archaeon]